MSSEPYEPVPAKAVDQLVKDLRPIVEGAEEMSLDQILDLPEAKQLIAAWGVKHEVSALASHGKVANWLVASMRRRGLGDRD
jgi:hypothetical protein